MKLRVTNQYCFLEEVGIVKAFLIAGVPFTFEDEGFDPTDAEVIAAANCNPRITMEDLYRYSNYLILEEAHPVLFNMENLIENYQDVPD